MIGRLLFACISFAARMYPWQKDKLRGFILYLAGIAFSMSAGAVDAQTTVPSGGTTASPPSAGTKETPVKRYRRAYVPADRPELWPAGGEKYLPIGRDEFTRLLEQTRGEDAQPRRVYLAEALYEASLAAEQLDTFFAESVKKEKVSSSVDEQKRSYAAGGIDSLYLRGRASWKVHSLEKGPTMLHLYPNNLAIAEAAWQGENGEKNDDAPTFRLGSKDRQRSLAIIPSSGVIRADWTLAGWKTAENECVFMLFLPQCPLSCFQLDLPIAYVLRVENGLASVESRGNSSDNSSMRRWRIKPGQSFPCRLWISRGEKTTAHLASAAFYDETRHYVLTPHGLDMNLRWSIHSAEEPIKSLSIPLEKDMRCTAVRMGDAELDWTVETSEMTCQTILQVHFPKPMRELTCEAEVSVPARRSQDALWTLPCLRPENLTWRQGKIIVETPPECELTDLVLHQCVQIQREDAKKPENVATTSAGEMYSFESCHPEATLAVGVRPALPIIAAVAATAVEMDAAEITARVVAEIRVERGEMMNVEGFLAPDWWIENVESSPGTLVADWKVEPTDSGGNRCVVHLAKPFFEGKTAKIMLLCRRLRDAQQASLSCKFFIPFHFEKPTVRRHVVSLTASDADFLKLDDADSFSPLPISQLDPFEASALSPSTKAILFEENDANRNTIVSIEPNRPAFSAKIKTAMTLEKQSMHESFAIRCEPKAAGVDRLRVDVFPVSDTPIRWTTGSGGEVGILAASRFSDAASSSVERWEIVLREPMREPFEIVACATVRVPGNAKPPSSACRALPNRTAPCRSATH